MISKKIVCINDLSGSGRCSLMTAIPIISVMGIQAIAVPTAILSAHTGFPNYSFFDFTPEMDKYFKNLNMLKSEYDMIYSGFLGSDSQIEIVTQFVKGHKSSKFLCDPVMGDNGKIYPSYTEKMCSEMKELVKMADIITPNITECCILLDEKYDGERTDFEKVKSYAKRLSDMGPETVIITGIKPQDKTLINLAYSKTADKFVTYVIEKTMVDYPGTGDIFASVIASCLVKGIDLQKALEKASLFIKEAAEATMKEKTAPYLGIMFEKYLYKLIEREE